MSLLAKLKANELLTPTENLIAQFILDNPDKAKDMSLVELAKASFVSKPTAIRFTRKMGYENYHDFKIALQVDLQQYTSQSPIDKNFPFKNKDTFVEIAETMGKIAHSVIDDVTASLDEFTLKNTIEILYNSKRIFIFAIGNCYIESQILISRLSRLNRHVILLNANSYPFAYLHNLTYGDVVLVLSSTGKTLQIERKTVKLIAQSKAKTVLITSDADLNLRKMFNYVLVIRNGEDALYKNETFASQTSILLILNIIYACLFEMDYNKNTERNDGISKLIKENYL